MDIRARAIALYDDYTHTHLDRRRFFRELTQLAGSLAAAQSLAATIAADPAAAAMIEPHDRRLRTGRVLFPGAATDRLRGYFAFPARGKGPWRTVLVVHENRGLNGYIEDVTRRLAVAGFFALAVDFLSPQGGTPTDEDKARGLIGALDIPHTVENALAALRWLKADARGNGKVGVVGFCWGGGMVNRIAIAAGNALDAGVAFYGPTPNPGEAVGVKAPMLLHYAGNDDRVNAGADAWVAALKRSDDAVVRYDYPGTEHAFHNDTSAARYNPGAASLAWNRTLAFFHKELK